MISIRHVGRISKKFKEEFEREFKSVSLEKEKMPPFGACFGLAGSMISEGERAARRRR